MATKILIAMDESENAFRSVAVVARTMSRDSVVTLFAILLDTAALCKLESPELIPLFKSQQAAFCQLESKKRELLETAMQQGRQVLLEAGFQPEAIKIKLLNKEKGVARDILKEAADGYDLVVIGRRGLSGIREFIMGSTSQKILDGSKNVSVLIVN